MHIIFLVPSRTKILAFVPAHQTAAINPKESNKTRMDASLHIHVHPGTFWHSSEGPYFSISLMWCWNCSPKHDHHGPDSCTISFSLVETICINIPLSCYVMPLAILRVKIIFMYSKYWYHFTCYVRAPPIWSGLDTPTDHRTDRNFYVRPTYRNQYNIQYKSFQLGTIFKQRLHKKLSNNINN